MQRKKRETNETNNENSSTEGNKTHKKKGSRPKMQNGSNRTFRTNLTIHSSFNMHFHHKLE